MNILKVDLKRPKKDDVLRIISELGARKVVILPTDTVYTFAVDAKNKEAIKLVYEIKGRDFNKPLHIIVANLEMAERYVEINNVARKLAKQFLPGQLTLILPKKKGVLPEILTSGLPTLGIRIPNFVLNRMVAEELGRPYTTTSANISGGLNPYSIRDVLDQLSEEKKKKIDLVVDVGQLPSVPPSTLFDLAQDHPRILREGPISKEQIEKVLGRKFLQTQV